MTTKEKILYAMNALPADGTIEDAMDRLLIVAKTERGLAQADQGQTISHSDLKQRIRCSLKSL